MAPFLPGLWRVDHRGEATERGRHGEDGWWAPRAISVTGIIVAETCAQPGITTLDQLNEEAATQRGAARIVAATCHEDGRISWVHLSRPTGESNVLRVDDEDADVAKRLRRALRASEL